MVNTGHATHQTIEITTIATPMKCQWAVALSLMESTVVSYVFLILQTSLENFHQNIITPYTLTPDQTSW